MRYCLQITEESILSKTDREHRADIDDLFAHLVSMFKAANLGVPTLKYGKNTFSRESLLTKSKDPPRLHFLTMPVLAYICFDLERQQILDVVSKILDPVIEAWLGEDRRKKIALELPEIGKKVTFFAKGENLKETQEHDI
jgi:hypothetical protein